MSGKAATARAGKATRIGAILDELYPAPPIPLEHEDPFTLLVAVMLSAQTTDKAVNQVTPALFSLAPTPEAMAAQPVEALLARIRSLGLAPTKAKNLKAMAALLCARHGGRVPDDEAALEALPGVGHKTASVVRSQAFGLPAFPVDTHIHRLAARWGLSSGRNVVHTERDLKALFPQAEWNRRHLQIIYFGREHCPARGHEPARCPICGWAAATRAGRARRGQDGSRGARGAKNESARGA
jgi:endonuclease-3